MVALSLVFRFCMPVYWFQARYGSIVRFGMAVGSLAHAGFTPGSGGSTAFAFLMCG